MMTQKCCPLRRQLSLQWQRAFSLSVHHVVLVALAASPSWTATCGQACWPSTSSMRLLQPQPQLCLPGSILKASLVALSHQLLSRKVCDSLSLTYDSCVHLAGWLGTQQMLPCWPPHPWTAPASSSPQMAGCSTPLGTTAPCTAWPGIHTITRSVPYGCHTGALLHFAVTPAPLPVDLQQVAYIWLLVPHNLDQRCSSA